MVRALGFHFQLGVSSYACIEKEDGSPANILASGLVADADLLDLYARWAEDTRLLWGLAYQIDGHRSTQLPADWPLTRPSTSALSHPAFAAGLWEWKNGRYGENDLFLWLRPEEVLWCEGEPGFRSSGRLPRSTPIRELWDQLYGRLSRQPNSVCLAVESQAPGAEILEETIRANGIDCLTLTPPTEEQSANRAALGAALTALDPTQTGVVEPRAPKKSRNPAAWLLLLLAAGCLLGTSELAHQQRLALANAKSIQLVESETLTPQTVPASPIPPNIQRWLLRRENFLQTLEASLQAAPPESLRRLEILTSPDATATQVRMLLSSDQQPRQTSTTLKLRANPARPGLWIGESNTKAP